MANYEPPERSFYKGGDDYLLLLRKGSCFTTHHSCQKFTFLALKHSHTLFCLEHSWAQGQRKLYVVHKPWKHFFEINSIESRLLCGTGYVRAALGAFALGRMPTQQGSMYLEVCCYKVSGNSITAPSTATMSCDETLGLAWWPDPPLTNATVILYAWHLRGCSSCDGIIGYWKLLVEVCGFGIILGDLLWACVLMWVFWTCTGLIETVDLVGNCGWLSWTFCNSSGYASWWLMSLAFLYTGTDLFPAR